MKLLPRFTSYIKDAAKSVKRITLQEFKEVADETLTELLGIASIGVKMFALRREGEHEVLHFGVPIARRLPCVHIAAHFQRKFIKKKLDLFVIWMCGAKRLSYIFFLAVSNAKIVVGLL